MVIWNILPRTNAYDSSITYILNDVDIESELGEIKDVTVLPLGGIEVSTSAKGDIGSASLSFIVKGENAYKEMTLHSYTDLENDDWIIYKIE